MVCQGAAPFLAFSESDDELVKVGRRAAWRITLAPLLPQRLDGPSGLVGHGVRASTRSSTDDGSLRRYCHWHAHLHTPVAAQSPRELAGQIPGISSLEAVVAMMERTSAGRRGGRREAPG